AEGLLDVFVEAGAMVSTPTCGACFGGSNGILADGEAAVATTNRNFRGRMGASTSGIYLANSYVAAAAAVAGEIVDPVSLCRSTLASSASTATTSTPTCCTRGRSSTSKTPR